jgi:hypothetical protein
MISPPCSPHTKDGEPALCARGVSQQVAMRCAGEASDPQDLKPGGWLALCWDCADDLSLFAGNIRAVREEWET